LKDFSLRLIRTITAKLRCLSTQILECHSSAEGEDWDLERDL